MICTVMALTVTLGGAEDPGASTTLAAAALLLPMIQTTGHTDRYEYDALGRLVKVITEVASETQTEAAYAYDPAGNRTQQTTVTSAPAPTHAEVIVVPLAGFTIITIQAAP